MLSYQNFKQINEKNIQKKYPYRRILVAIESYDDFKTICDYISNTFGVKISSAHYESFGYSYPNFASIDIDDLYRALNTSVAIIVNIWYFSVDESDINNIKEFIKSRDYIDYANVDDVLNMDSLDKIPNMIYQGENIISYNDLYSKNRNVYDSYSYIKHQKPIPLNEKNIQKEYPYDRILISIESYDDFKTVCDYISNTFNVEVDSTSYLSLGFGLPNFASINMGDLYNALKTRYNDTIVNVRHFSANSTDDDKVRDILKNPNYTNFANIDDILNINNLDKIPNMVYKGEKLKNYTDIYNKNTNIYESINETIYPYTYIMVEVNSKDDIKKLFDYMKDVFGCTSDYNSLTNNYIKFKNYILINLDSLINGNGYPFQMYDYYYNGDILDKIEKWSSNIPNCVNIDDILTIDTLDEFKNLVEYGKKTSFKSIYNNNNKNIYESLNTNYPYEYIIIEVNSYDDIKEIYDYLKNKFNHNPHYAFLYKYRIKFKNYVLINVDNLINGSEFAISMYLLSYDDDDDVLNKIKEWTLNNSTRNIINFDDILTVKNLNDIISMLKYGKRTSFNAIYTNNKNNKNIYESNNTLNVLNVFDLDETLVFNSSYEENIKHLLLEYKKPTDIFLDILNKKNIDISKLKYENGRIYFNDPQNQYYIDEYDTELVRKKDRIYLTQPDEYLLTDESLPVSVNDKILEIYNNSLNNSIITARLDKTKPIITKRLKELGIKEPNYGLFMLNDKYSNKVKFKSTILINLQNNNNFDVINYYDDNIKLLKNMNKYLTEKNYNNINLFKVTKNEIRKI